MRIVSMLSSLLFCCAAARAGIQTETVTYEVNGKPFKGYLAYDDTASGKRPLILVVHEWWGLGDFVKSECRRLAEIGYVAFAVDMYGDGKFTTSQPEAGKLATAIKGDTATMRERFEAALAVAKKNEHVDAQKIGAMGFCFGGTVALEMARSNIELMGVVSFHGGLKSALPSAPEEIKTKILVCHGANDPAVTQEEVSGFVKQMRETKADWQFIEYANTVHAFTNPDANMPPAVMYNESSARRSWELMKSFWIEVFAEHH